MFSDKDKITSSSLRATYTSLDLHSNSQNPNTKQVKLKINNINDLSFIKHQLWFKHAAKCPKYIIFL